MALIYRVVQRKNSLPNAKTPMNAYAVAKQTGQVSLNDLAEDIADRCTVHRADVKAVLDALSISVVSFLKLGFGVSLGELGSFSMRLKSTATPTSEEFTSDHIKRAHVRYTPSVEMKTRIKAFSFTDMKEMNEMKQKADSGTVTPGTGEETGGSPGEGEDGVI